MLKLNLLCSAFALAAPELSGAFALSLHKLCPLRTTQYIKYKIYFLFIKIV
jgi:hypothetical protein